MYSRYVPIKMLIANKFRLLFTYNADSIRDLTSLESLWTFIKSVVIFHCFKGLCYSLFFSPTKTAQYFYNPAPGTRFPIGSVLGYLHLVHFMTISKEKW